ncbi:MAG: hypothetical protein SCH70_12975, partial [Candidatus Methanoperedens sp.]|nr:hypothetical protein [Candidatus Methanoperedens sp.]
MPDNNQVIKAEDNPCEYMCKHCSRTIDYVLYTKHGKLPLLHGAISDGDLDIGEQILLCPECYNELTCSELHKAGPLLCVV